ncbi:MAG: hypothetical protein ACOX68_02480 [Candidatus Limivicinus sp.]|jgi:hypothetical protein
MKFFKRRAVAVILSIILILFTTFLSVNMRLEKRQNEVTEGFVNGVYVDGELQESIYSQLREIYAASSEIISIAKLCGIDTEEAYDQCEYLNYGLTTIDDDVSYMHYCYTKLGEDIDDLLIKLKETDISDADKAEIDSQILIIREAEKRIANSGYNESVRKYINSLTSLERYFANATGVYGPEYFA